MENEAALLEADGEATAAPNKRSSRVIAKVLVSSVLMGVSFCFLFSPALFALSNSSNEGRIQETPLMEETSASHARLPEMALDVKKEVTSKEKCDLFTGEWIPEPLGPAYTNSSCNFIEAPQNCMRNGRPDSLYLYWRWKPHGCDLPQFDPENFMKDMQNKSWALIGDSIFRNHIQSMICLLSKVEQPVEVYHDEGFKSRTWYFPSNNFTLAVIWAPFLVKAKTSDDTEGKGKGLVQLHLDVLNEKWTNEYHKYDYVMIAGGQWFLKSMVIVENGAVVGCHNCDNQQLKELGIEYPYHKALETALRFVATSDHKPLVIFRTWTPSHFEYGEWFSGGVCNRTLPYNEGQYNGQPSDQVMQHIEIEEFERAKAIGSKNGARMRLLDIFHLSLVRPDGHPGPYRSFHPFDEDKNAKVQNDCLHWCLPGPIDYWNDIVMEILRRGEEPTVNAMGRRFLNLTLITFCGFMSYFLACFLAYV